VESTHRILEDALTVFEDVATGHEKISIRGLQKRHQLSYATCYRIVRTFLEKGWLEQDEHGILRSAPNLMIKIDPRREQEFLLEILKDQVEKLVRTLSLSAKLTMREDCEAFSFFTSSPPKEHRIFSKLSSRFHLAAGSSGACHLSGFSDEKVVTILKSAPEHYWKNQTEDDVLERLQAVRESGVCFDLGSTSQSWFAASTPLRWPNGKVATALTVVGPPSHFNALPREQIRASLLGVSEFFASRMKQIPDLASSPHSSNDPCPAVT
jgi:DNA-binding IclR family transcriptional regulator